MNKNCFYKTYKCCSFLSILAVFLFLPAFSYAQNNKEPKLPETLQTMSDQGAQIRYLGKSFGMDGWVTMKAGQEQYFYQTPDKRGLVMGLMFDHTGKLITLRQVNELRQKEGDVLDMFALPEDRIDPYAGAHQSVADFKTPSEQLYSDIENSNWIALGDVSAPAIYTFIDPQCPHCHNFLKDMKDNFIGSGMVQVRVVPVGFRDDTLAQAAFLLAAPDPEERLYRHLEGDSSALPITKSVNKQGVQRNMAIMQSWKLDVTPISVYQAEDGSIKIIQGRVKDIPALLAELPKS
jgi:thiol:disulfide interchange protein DsbG